MSRYHVKMSRQAYLNVFGLAWLDRAARSPRCGDTDGRKVPFFAVTGQNCAKLVSCLAQPAKAYRRFDRRQAARVVVACRRLDAPARARVNAARMRRPQLSWITTTTHKMTPNGRCEPRPPAPAGKTRWNHQHHREHDRMVESARVGVGSTFTILLFERQR